MQQAISPQHAGAANAANALPSSNAAALALKSLVVMVDLSEVDEGWRALIDLVRRAPGNMGGARCELCPGGRPVPPLRPRPLHTRAFRCSLRRSAGLAGGGGAVRQALAPLQTAVAVRRGGARHGLPDESQATEQHDEDNQP